MYNWLKKIQRSSQMVNNIYKKIKNNTRLTDKEIDYINDASIVSVYDFTYCIGHLTNFGKNSMVLQYKDEILKELVEHLNA